MGRFLDIVMRDFDDVCLKTLSTGDRRLLERTKSRYIGEAGERVNDVHLTNAEKRAARAAASTAAKGK